MSVPIFSEFRVQKEEEASQARHDGAVEASVRGADMEKAKQTKF